MRVAVLTRRWSVRGGNERQAVELTRQLIAHGHHPHVYCHKADDTVDAFLPEDCLHRIAGIRFDPTAAQLSYAWATRRLVRRWRAHDEFDVSIGFGASTHQDVYRLGGGVHAEFLRLTKDHPGARGGPVLDRVALRLERARMRPTHTRHFVAPSERVREELREHYGIEDDRVTVIPNGTRLERFTPEGDRAEIGPGPIALFVGQDPLRKGLDSAIEATRRAGITLAYVGPAPRPHDCPEHVIWVGERRDVERYYRGADLLLAPSRYDPFGGVVLEALACGRPVVATRRIGATERMIGSPLERLLIESPEDVEGLSTRIHTALAEAASLSTAARSLVEHADLETWGRRMIDVLEKGKVPASKA